MNKAQLLLSASSEKPELKYNILLFLLVLRVGRFVRRNHCVEFIANREKLVFRHDVLTGGFHVVFVNSRFDNRVNRAGLFAEPAIDTLEQIDVVTRGSPGAVITDI